MINFLIQKKVVFTIALPMMAANILGGYLGSKMAVKKCNGFIRWMFIFIMIILISKMVFDVYF